MCGALGPTVLYDLHLAFETSLFVSLLFKAFSQTSFSRKVFREELLGSDEVDIAGLCDLTELRAESTRGDQAVAYLLFVLFPVVLCSMLSELTQSSQIHCPTLASFAFNENQKMAAAGDQVDLGLSVPAPIR
jgi:hypothetical protein